jgi:hypothetical protein
MDHFSYEEKYKFLKNMHPRQFVELKLEASTGALPFDELVDREIRKREAERLHNRNLVFRRRSTDPKL